MKQQIENLLRLAVTQLQETGVLPVSSALIEVSTVTNHQHGDLSSNIALLLAQTSQLSAQQIAEQIVAALPQTDFIQTIEIAPAGFINFFLSAHALTNVVEIILQQKENFGRCKIGREKLILVEFVSSTPTGPLQVEQGRHAAFGNVIANLLDAVGFKVAREFYVNDADKNIDVLVAEVWFHYLHLCNQTNDIASNESVKYIISIAKAIYHTHGAQFCCGFEHQIDKINHTKNNQNVCVEIAKQSLKERYIVLFDLILAHVLADIREDLAEFGVHFDRWSFERAFISKGSQEQLLSRLKSSGHVYRRDDALLFRSTDFGDDKDRVLFEKNNELTFYANDVAYHLNKFDRGFDIAVDLFGATYQNYAPRMKAAMEASGINPERLQVLIIQSTDLINADNHHSLLFRELRNQVGNDVAKIIFLMHKNNERMIFNLDLACKTNNENPAFFLLHSLGIMNEMLEQPRVKNAFNEANGLQHLHLLTADSERRLLNTLTLYPDIIINAAIQYEPYLLVNYLRDLILAFFHYYHEKLLDVQQGNLFDARLTLLSAVKQIVLNGFYILGIR